MTGAKPWIPLGLGLCMISAQATVVILNLDVWPLSNYPMFAYPISAEAINGFQMQAKIENGSTVEVPVLGGAATLFVYHRLMDGKDFTQLQKQMTNDFVEYRKVSKNDRVSKVTELQLVRVGLEESHQNGEVWILKKPFFSFAYSNHQ